MDNIKYWVDQKGRVIEVHTMSNKWLHNICNWNKKLGREKSVVQDILDELKRRKNKRK